MTVFSTIEDVTGQDVVDYSPTLAGDFDQDAMVDSALAAEKVAQTTACRVQPYTNALAEALLRRVVRNLAMRNVPLGVQSDPETGGIRLGSTDPEVRRLEAPYRKRVVG